MGQKTSPISMRLGINKSWASRWFGGKNYVAYLKDDIKIREFLKNKLRNMAVDHIDIERTPTQINVMIHTARPGLIIGRGGAGVEEVKNELVKYVKTKTPLKIDIIEFKEPEISATILAESISEQLERRIPFRRILKQTISRVMSNKKVAGAKIQVAGRLNGAEIARTEYLREGSLPLQTFRAEIDFAKETAHTTYGTVGVKVWIYRNPSKE